MRKLYTYNTFHAALAYRGALRGCETIADCFADTVVLDGAKGALDESCRALQAEYGWSKHQMARWADGVVAQTDNPTLGDTVARYGADPRRKLGRSDRIVGPLLLARRHNILAPYLTQVLVAALLYRDPNDAGAAAVLAQVMD
ncbi:MAG: mannitol-1-phosphate 5-dehydrogenase, partial [Anaerolineae bacterium]